MAGDGKPVHLQHALSWAETEDEAIRQALHQWASVVAGGEVNLDLRRPADFDRLAEMAGPQTMARCLKISSDLSRHLAWIAALSHLGANHIYLHCVGRNQQAFIERFGREMDQLRAKEA